MKNISGILLFLGMLTMGSLAVVYTQKQVEAKEATILKVCDETTNESQYMHDWECKFVIEDGYNGDGKQMFHYINEYKRNVDHSITFVGDDGLLWTIPYRCSK